MHSFETQETGTCDPKMNVSNSLAGHAASRLAFSDDKLEEVGALLVQLVLAAVLVHLVYLIVPASELGQALETHGGGIERGSRGLVLWRAKCC